jgi:hypothetical protein
MPDCRIALLLVVGSLTASARGQEQDWNEDRQFPARVPAAVFRLAEKEAPGVSFGTVFKNREKEYRLVGKTAEGKTVSVRIDRDVKLISIRTMTDVALARVPRPVLLALQGEIRKKPELEGLQPTRTLLVDEFEPAKNANATFYEFLGKTAQNPYYLVQVARGGEVRLVKGVQLHPSHHIQRKPIAPNALPGPILAGATQAAPGVRFTRAYMETSDLTPETHDYIVIGRGDRGRRFELTIMSNGFVYVIRAQVALPEVPRAAIDAAGKLAQEDPNLKGFKPVEARRLRLLHFQEKGGYLLYGDDAEGKPVEVRIEDDGRTMVSDDPRVDEEGPPAVGAAEEGIPAQGFAVLAARFGRENHWIDVTDRVRPAVSDGMMDYLPGDLPDPAYGSAKGLVIAYSDDGKVGLSASKESQKAVLPPSGESARLAEVPARGFAVLAARYGSEDKWADVTDAVRARVAEGRVECNVPDLKLADPFPNAQKAMAIAYSVDGKVGLSVITEARPISLPPLGPPLNSSALEARVIEFAQGVSGVAFTPDGRQVVAGVEDGTVRVIDVATGREAHRFEGHGKGAVPLAVASSGNLVLSGGADSNLRLWDLKNGRERAIFRGHAGPITNIALSTNGKLAASSSWDKTARIWEVATSKEVHRIAGHTEVVMGVAFLPDSRQLATTSWDQSARIWDTSTGREVRKTEGENGQIGDVAISRDGRQVYFGAKDGRLKVWEPATGNAPMDVRTFMPCGWSIASFPDNRRLLFTDENAGVVWDLRANRTVLRLDRQTAQVVGLAVSTDGRRAASASRDRTLRIWNLPEPPR